MALARIITRSQVCARELATDLVARGYAVEIVTPDAVPHTSADLELRVEEDPGNQLVASVHAHDGPRSASFEFRHQLRGPMRDFLRTIQETTEVVYLSEEPVRLAESNSERIVLPATAQPLEIETVSAPAPVLLELCSDPGSIDSCSIDSCSTDSRPPDSFPREAAPPLPELQPPRPVETVAVAASHLAKESAAAGKAQTMAQPLLTSTDIPPAMIPPRRELRARKRPERWQWRAALAFTSMVSLALVLGFGLHYSEKAIPPVPGASATEKVAVPSIDSYPSSAASEDVLQKDSTTVPGQISNLPASPSAAQWGWAWDRTPKDSTVGNAEDEVVKASIVNKTIVNNTIVNNTINDKTINDKTNAGKVPINETGRSRTHDDSSIAPDTVTYFDGRHQPIVPKAQPAKRLAWRDPTPHKHSGGVVAANTVTYLNKPIPKPAK